MLFRSSKPQKRQSTQVQPCAINAASATATAAVSSQANTKSTIAPTHLALDDSVRFLFWMSIGSRIGVGGVFFACMVCLGWGVVMVEEEMRMI